MIARSGNDDRLPPNNAGAERAVIGNCLVFPEAIADAAEAVRPGDFFRREHRLIFAAMHELHRHNQLTDPIMVAETLRRGDELDAAGGECYLADLAAQAATPTTTAHHAELVRDRARLRAIIGAATAVAGEAYEGAEPAAAILARAQATLAAIADPGALAASTATDLCVDAFRATTDRTPPDAVTTGFVDLDYHFGGGLHRGNVTMLGARASVGKTAKAIALAIAAAKSGAPTLFVSLEMSRAEIGDRLLAQVSGLSLRDIRARALTPVNLRRAADAQNIVRAWGLNLEVIDQGCRTVAALSGLLRRRAAAGRPVRVVILDYAQLLQPERAASLREAYTAVSRDLKNLAKELGVSLVVLAQLRREAEGRPGENGRTLLRPCAADLKETGAWEEDADQVLLLWREPGTPDVLRCEVDKNRHGANGVTVYLSWHAESATPRSLTAREEALLGASA